MARVLVRRIRNWDTLLFDWAAGVQGRPFEWGVCDCATLVRQAVEVMYGFDPFEVDQWRSLKEALATHEATGGTEAMLDAVGGRVAHPGFLQTGDIVTAYPELDDETPIQYAGVVLGKDVVGVRQDEMVTFTPFQAYPMGVKIWKLPNA